jgi:Na+-driven multidrug efflux pump
MYSIAIGMSMAATAMVARRIGEKNPEQASRSAAQVLLVSFVITLILSLLGVSMLKKF